MWWFFVAVAAASLAGVVRLSVLSASGDVEARGSALGAALFVVVFGAIGLRLAHRDLRARAADRSGPVAPAPTEHAPTKEQWGPDEMAAQLARELAPMNGVIFREGRSRRLRIMLDPVSSITVTQRVRRVGTDDPPSTRSLAGEWWSVIWRRGRAPTIRARTSTVRLGHAPGIGPIPVWRSLPIAAVSVSPGFVVGPRRPDGWSGELRISSAALFEAVDRIAVDSGWASAGQVTSTRRTAQPARDRTVTVTQEAPGRTRTRTVHGDTVSHRMDEVHATDTSVQRTRTSRPSSSSDAHRGLGAVGAASRPPHAPHRGDPPDGAGSSRRIARIMTIIGLAIMAACLLATGIGLIAGMVWWASFIIVGAGLLFCLLFVLPVVLLARFEAR